MIRYSTTISLVPEAKDGPFIFHHDLQRACQAAQSLGFHGIELFPPNGAAIDRANLRQLLDQHELQLAAVGTGAGWLVHKLHLSHQDADVRCRAREFVQQIIALASEFDAPVIIGSMQGRADAPDLAQDARERLRESIARLAEEAHKAGTRLLIEPLNRYETNLLNRLSDATELIRSIEATNIRVLADLFHMNIEETCIAGALREAGQFLGHVHFVDSNRLAPGMGHLDFLPIANALREINYNGFVSAEALPRPDSEAAAATTIKTYRAFLDAA